MLILRIEIFVLFLVLAALAVCALKAAPVTICKLEKLCRNRIVGLVLSLPCALLCVPLAVPVTPAAVVPWLYPLALVLPILSYWHLDYYASRGVAFLLILASYDIVHYAFDSRLGGAGVVTVILLLLGIAGIWIAAKPCTLRDIFRKCAASSVWKYSVVSCGVLGAVTVLYTLIRSVF